MEAAGITELVSLLARGNVRAIGLDPAIAGVIAARTERPTVVVTRDEASANAAVASARLFLRDPDHALHITQNPSEPYAEVSGDTTGVGSRMAALHRLLDDSVSVIAASVASLLRRVVTPTRFRALSRTVKVGDVVSRDELAAFLLSAGYRRFPVVDDPGTFSMRGDIVDVFAPSSRFPIRIELFGDEVESLRRFDPTTQRTLRGESALVLHPCREAILDPDVDLRARLYAAADRAAHPSAQTRQLWEALERGEDFVGVEVFVPAFHRELVPLWSYLPPRPSLIILDPEGVKAAAADSLVEATLQFEQRQRAHKISFAPAEHFVATAELLAYFEQFDHTLASPRLELEGDSDQTLRVAITTNRELARALLHSRKRSDPAGPIYSALKALASGRARVAVVAGSESRASRIAGLLDAGQFTFKSSDLPVDIDGEPGITLYKGSSSGGFSASRDRFALISDSDLFGERRQRDGAGAAQRAHKALLGAVGDFSQLGDGDFLVHQVHGVGRYRGLAKLPIGEHHIDFLNIEYTGGTLYLPVFRIGEVQRYVGAEGHGPRVDRLGGVSWAKTRGRVRRDVAALAEALLQLYAQRAALPGRAFPAADAMFRDFEATFEFEETPDQEAAIDAVLADMEKPRPMDRLVCGDVGYGKTEVALRAMLKASLGGAQVAMLAPTTVLVEQHFQTMKTRFADWPVSIGKLSRFQKRADQLATLASLADGSIDAVVGTHRLLSKDVRWRDLGLIIVDEEQRFGVTHKERLKSLRTQVDVLTLTATPIPRTLHLAMAGLRDLSIIATPPADRRSIRTFVARAEDTVLQGGIRRELARGGQIFFVVPRIDSPVANSSLSLAEWAKRLAELVPDARIAQAHGQMPTEALEKSMVSFVSGESDILVSTSIVESGLDIPSANTMFIADADRFGLAQLYQLRGRIGRSKERAFCYLLIGPSGKVTDNAMRRLETLQRFTDLGAGFMIASQDLEIRGAGELLGSKQSGFIAAVGFDAYTQMLEEAVGELRGEPIHPSTDPELAVEVPGYIPDDYVEDTGQRLTLYKRLGNCRSDDEISELMEEIGDRYGPPPSPLVLLAELMSIKSLARQLGAQALDVGRAALALTVGENTLLDAGKIATLVSTDPSFRLTPEGRLQYRFSESEKSAPTEAAKRCLLHLHGCVTPARPNAGKS